MSLEFANTAGHIKPPLDEGFRPAAVFNRAFRDEVGSAGIPVLIGLQRSENEFSRFETRVLDDKNPKSAANFLYIERIVKFLLWQRGAYKLYFSGPREIAQYLRESYSDRGRQQFDYHFMGEQVYEREFRIEECTPEEMPASYESSRYLGRHLRGNRIGFDLGASDRKASAVVDGKVIYSEEVIWEPRLQSDPEYHYREIRASIQSAAARLPRVDAIGGSSAGIYIGNRPMVASLFRGVPQERYDEVKNLFISLRNEMGVPLEVINDGDVTALAGSMSLNENGILGIALGSSEAAGYVNMSGSIMGWLNELAFAPIDYSPTAPVDEWSGDTGCGASYLSQQCVFRLASRAGIQIPTELGDAEKLKFVQALLEAGHSGAVDIWKSMGIYLGYAVAHYADFYELKHVLILGRCTSGPGGQLLLDGAIKVLRSEFPDIAEHIKLHLPDETMRRVGQAVAAASLPA
jgi:predicted NBD/HSP70 family sugar kinase